MKMPKGLGLGILALALSWTNATAQAPAQSEVEKIETRLKAYDAAFNAKDLEKLAMFYHPDVTIFEGGGVNNGWADYRDHHLGLELKGFENLEFAHNNIRVHLLGDGRAAYVTSEYSIKTRNSEGGGLETLVMVKDGDGSWKIRHSHTSSRRRPSTPAAPKPFIF